MAPSVSLRKTAKYAHKMFRQADWYQLNLLTRQQFFFFLQQANCISLAVVFTVILCVILNTTQHYGRKQARNSGHKNPACNFIYTHTKRKKNPFRRDLLWDWDIHNTWIASPHCPTLLKCDGHKEKKLGKEEIERQKKRGKAKERQEEGGFSLYTPTQCITFALCIPKLFVLWYKIFMRLLLTEYNTAVQKVWRYTLQEKNTLSSVLRRGCER